MDIITLRKPNSRVVLALEPAEAVKVANLLDYAYHNSAKVSEESKGLIKEIVRSAARLEQGIKGGGGYENG